MELIDYESESLEYKRELPKTNKLAKTLIAFANGKGGRLVIGYDEKSQKVVGIIPSQRSEEKIANVVNDLCDPKPAFQISYESQGDKVLMIIKVHAGNETPYHLKNKSLESSTFIRVGSTTRVADKQNLAKLIRQGRNISYDSEIISKKSLLDKNLLKTFLEKRKARLGAKTSSLNNTLLKDLKLMGERNKPSVAGALLFLDEPQQLPEFSESFIRAARFKGKTPGVFLDQQDLMGPLSQQIDDALRFVLRNIRLSGVVAGSKRQEAFEYPEEIIREMIVNAIIHRDYSITGSHILLAIFDDRIELTSPGGLPTDVTVQSISERQYNRNPIIAKRMFEMGYFDSWGHGIDKIITWSQANTGQMPLFEDRNNQFKITVFSPLEIINKNTVPQKYKENELDEVDQKIINYVKKKDKITNRECQKNFKLSKMQAQLALKQLVEAKILEQRGSGRSTHYIFIE